MNFLRHIKDSLLTAPDGTAGSSFEKSKTAGRKSLFRMKEKTLAPEIMEDRLEPLLKDKHVMKRRKLT